MVCTILSCHDHILDRDTSPHGAVIPRKCRVAPFAVQPASDHETGTFCHLPYFVLSLYSRPTIDLRRLSSACITCHRQLSRLNHGQDGAEEHDSNTSKGRAVRRELTFGGSNKQKSDTGMWVLPQCHQQTLWPTHERTASCTPPRPPGTDRQTDSCSKTSKLAITHPPRGQTGSRHPGNELGRDNEADITGLYQIYTYSNSRSQAFGAPDFV